jgi:AhpD family alkylhydroperoxidase
MQTHADTAARIDWDEFTTAAPAVLAALRALGTAVDESGLDKHLTELLKLRASQLNGCAFCLQFHLNIARKLKIPQAKIDLVAVWADAPVFSARERAALAWCEALTTMAQHHVADAVYADVCAHFTRTEVLHLTAAIGAINAWNRLAGGLRFTPPVPPSASEEGRP